MSALSSVLRKLEGGRAAFWCPGCEEAHVLCIEGTYAWGFNGDYEKPTLTPSVKVTGKEPLTESEYERIAAGEEIEKPDTICHSFVTDGRIQFLTDSTHALAGQTVDLPAWGERQL